MKSGFAGLTRTVIAACVLTVCVAAQAALTNAPAAPKPMQAVPGRIRLEVSRDAWSPNFTPLPKSSGIERLKPGTPLAIALPKLGLLRIWRAFGELEQPQGSATHVISYADWVRLRQKTSPRPNALPFTPPDLPTAPSQFELEFPPNADTKALVNALQQIKGVVSAAQVIRPSTDFVPNDPGWLPPTAPGFDPTLAAGRWGFYNTGPAIFPLYVTGFDIGAPAAWDIQRGSPSVVVAVFDTEIDVTHPDLYLNVYLNNGEVPPDIVTRFKGASTEDGLPDELTFYDLNVPSVVAALASMGYHDTNGNGYIDAEDVVAWWSNGVDDDHNGKIDDLVGWNFAAGTNRPFATPTTFEHGTRTAGLIAAIADNGIGIAGVAHHVRFMPVTSVLNLAEVSYALSFPAVRVINQSMSLLYSGGTQHEVNDLLATLDSEGVVFVSSLGDIDEFVYGDDPSQREPVISVTNFNGRGYRARLDSSSFGPKTDVAAPGEDLYSTVNGGGTFIFGGTSASSPMTAGVAALVASQNPLLTPEQIRQVLRMTATDPPPVPGDLGENTPGWDLYSGWGLVNAAHALAAVASGTQFAEANILSRPRNFWSSVRREDMSIGMGVLPIRARIGIPTPPGTPPAMVSWRLLRSPTWDMSDGTVVAAGTTPYLDGTTPLTTVDSDSLDGRQLLELEVTTASGTVSREQAVIDLPRAYISNLAAGQIVVAPPAIDGFAYGPGFSQYSVQVAPGWSPSDGDFATVFTSTTQHAPALPADAGDLAEAQELLPRLDVTALPITIPPTGQITIRVRTQGARNWTGDVGVIVPSHAPFRAGFPIPGSPIWNLAATAVDLDGSGAKEIIAGELIRTTAPEGFPIDQSVIRAIRSDGTPQPGFPLSFPIFDSDGFATFLNEPPAVGDIDGDGHPEIVTRSYRGDDRTDVIHVIRADGTFATAGWPAVVASPFPTDLFGFPVNDNRRFVNAPVLADVTGDGRLDILVAINRGATVSAPTVRAYRGDGSVAVDYATMPDLEFVGQPAVGDIDGDGDVEIAAVAHRETDPAQAVLYVWRRDGTVDWTASLLASPGDPAFPTEGPILADLEGDGRLEVIAATDGGGRVRVFRSDGTVFGVSRGDFDFRIAAAQFHATGPDAGVVYAAANLSLGSVEVRVLDPDGTFRPGWTREFPFTGGTPSAQPVVADIRGDGALEIACSGVPTDNTPGAQPSMTVAEPDGTLVSDAQWPLRLTTAVSVTPLVTDLTNSGHPQFVMQTDPPFANLMVFDLPVATHPGWNAWGEESHDPWHTSNLNGGLRIISPSTVNSDNVGPFDDPGFQSALVIRTEFARGQPSGGVALPGNWTVTIGGVTALVESVTRVGTEYWLAVSPVAQPAAGPETLRVNYNDGGIHMRASYRDAVVYEGSDIPHATVADIDRSAAMSAFGKLDIARPAARFFADSAYTYDRVGVVSFADTARNDLSPAALLDAGTHRTAIDAAIDGLTAGGSTSIGAGINSGLGIVTTAGGVRQSIVLLAGEPETTVPLWSSVEPRTLAATTAGNDLHVHTIAFGPGADLTLMENIASATGGSFFPISPLGPGHASTLNRLADVYHSARERIDHTERLLTFTGAVHPATPVNRSVLVPFRTRRLQFAFNWDRPLPAAISIQIRRPDGTIVLTTDGDVASFSGETDAIFTFDTPQPGTWQVVMQNRAGQDVEVLLAASAFVPFGIHVTVTEPILRNALYQIHFVMTNAKGPVPGETVTATVTRPNGTTFDVALSDDGKHDDGSAGDGIFAASLPLIDAGGYLVTLQIAEQAGQGPPLTLSRTFGVVVPEPPKH